MRTNRAVRARSRIGLACDNDFLHARLQRPRVRGHDRRRSSHLNALDSGELMQINHDGFRLHYRTSASTTGSRLAYGACTVQAIIFLATQPNASPNAATGSGGSTFSNGSPSSNRRDATTLPFLSTIPADNPTSTAGFESTAIRNLARRSLILQGTQVVSDFGGGVVAPVMRSRPATT